MKKRHEIGIFVSALALAGALAFNENSDEKLRKLDYIGKPSEFEVVPIENNVENNKGGKFFYETRDVIYQLKGYNGKYFPIKIKKAITDSSG